MLTEAPGNLIWPLLLLSSGREWGPLERVAEVNPLGMTEAT